MKKLFLFLFTAISLCSASSFAGYAVKKVQPSTSTEQATTTGTAELIDATVKSTFTTADVSTADEELSMVTGKKNIFTKISDRLKESLDISKGVYVILAIIGFGWLAMGLNDNFEGFDWLISLLLYILGWLPGVIYTLIMMKKYY
jgi:uncharacterized membrane protein YqaE (UPF0057 family)